MGTSLPAGPSIPAPVGQRPVSISRMLVVSLAVAAGCGGPASQGDRQRISGAVSLGETPLASGSIMFQSTAPGGAGGGGVIRDGRYELAAEAGLPAGDYAVEIRPGAAADSGPAPGMKFDEITGAEVPISLPARPPARPAPSPRTPRPTHKIPRTIHVTDAGPNAFDFRVPD